MCNNFVIIKKFDFWFLLMVYVYKMYDFMIILIFKLIMNYYYFRKLFLELRDFFKEFIFECIWYVYWFEEDDCDL